MDKATGPNNEKVKPHQYVTQLVRELHEMLDETVASENANFATVAMPTGVVSERLAELCYQLRQQFTLEEDGHWLDSVLCASPQYMDAVRRLQSEHKLLVEQLGDVYELAGSPVRPGASASEVRSSFCIFVARLADHELREDDLLFRVLSDDVGVVD